MCLTENDLAAFVCEPEGSPLRAQVEAHVDECVYCRALLANFIGTWGAEDSSERTNATDVDHHDRFGSPADPATKFGPGSLLVDRFELERIVGRGGTSVVWAAYDHARRSSRVALKILTLDHVDARRRMLREARIANRIGHAAIVPVETVLELDDDGPIVLVTELLSGMTLGSYFRGAGPLSADETRALFLPLMDGVAAAHRLGVIHRDLKPDNVFLAEDAHGARTVKILDFGVAKLTVQEILGGPAESLTQSGMLVGTVRYMALEQLLVEKDIDARADIWALGLMLYEALSGASAIEGKSFMEVFGAVSSGSIVPLRERRQGIPAHLADLVDSMLACERVNRPGHLEPLMAVLARV